MSSRKIEWKEDERALIIERCMEISANIEDYQGVIIIYKKANGIPVWNWAGPDECFSDVDVIALTELCHDVTKKELLERFVDQERDEQ